MKPEEFRTRLRGVIAFPVTPFKPDLSLDQAGLRKNVHELLRHPIAAIVAAGGTGEMYSLTPAEHQAVVKTIADEADGKIPVICGTGFNLQLAIELAQRSARAGADGILALPPYYPNADEEGLAEYYAAIGAATALGLFVYSRDWVKPSPEWVEQLARRIPTLIAWKDGQGDTLRYQQIIDRVGSRLYCIGGRGTPGCPLTTKSASVLTLQVSPRSRPNFHCAWTNSLPPGIPPLTELMNEYVNPLYAIRARRKGYEVSVMKEMMNLIGLAAGPVRPPLPNLRSEEVAEIKGMLEKWKPFLS